MPQRHSCHSSGRSSFCLEINDVRPQLPGMPCALSRTGWLRLSRRNTMARLTLTAALITLLASAALAQQTGFFQTSVVCGTESRHGWAQVFGETPGGWRQFDAMANLPRGTQAVAKIWKGPFGNTLVLVTLAQNNLASQTTYCFHPDGSLLALDHQVR